MAGSFADYAEDKTLDFWFGGVDMTPPATLYAAAFTDSNTGTQRDAGTVTEATGGSYARVAITNNATNFPAASGGAKSNGTDIDFVTATASWGTVNAVGFYDAASGGNLVAWGDLDTPKLIDTGDQLRVPAGSLTLTQN